MLEYDGANVLQARYTHGPGIDEPIAVTKGGATYFYHQDGLGTVTDLTDSTGATAKSYSYDAYGNILESPGTIEQPYTYTGREFDAESGLYYYRARYYDPASGRFISKDPSGMRNGVALYAALNNSPVNFIDYTGLDAKTPSKPYGPEPGPSVGKPNVPYPLPPQPQPQPRQDPGNKRRWPPENCEIKKLGFDLKLGVPTGEIECKFEFGCNESQPGAYG